MDLSSILAQMGATAQNSNAQLADAQSLISNILSQNAATQTQIQESAAADIPAAQAVAAQSAEVDAQRAQTLQQLQIAANLDPAQADNAYTAGLANLTAINAQRTAARKELTALQSKSLFDDPIGYVMAQIQAPALEARAQALDNEATAATADMTQRLDLLAKAKSTITANTVDAVKNIQLETARLKANDAARKVQEQEVQNRAGMATQYFQIAQLADKQNDNWARVFSAQLQAAQFEETRAERRAMFDERMAAKSKESEDEAVLAQKLTAASALLGYAAPMTPLEYKRLGAGSPQKRALDSLIHNNMLGADLGDVYENFRNGKGNVNAIALSGDKMFAETMRSITSAIDKEVIAQRGKINASTGKPTPEKMLVPIAAADYQGQLEESAKNPKGRYPLSDPKWDSTFNPYKANHKLLIAEGKAGGQYEGLANNVMRLALEANLAATPAGDSYPAAQEQQALQSVAKQVAAGALSENDAARDIAAYYRSAAAINRAKYKYELLGLPPQDTYMYKAQMPSAFGTGVKDVDLMNEVSVKSYILSLAAKSKPGLPGLSLLDFYGTAAEGQK